MNIAHFLQHGIWELDASKLSTGKRQGIKAIKILLLSLRGFVSDHCSLRASALTLFTLLSIVPIIAMLFGIAKGFGFEKNLEERIFEQVPEQDTMMLQIIEFAQNLLATTKGGVVAGIGIAMLFWTVIKVISNIEDSFNHIWNIDKARTISRKLSDYLSLMLLAPVLIILASSISVYVSAKINELVSVMQIKDTSIDFSLHVLNMLPMLIIWTLFSFLFVFMPNTRVKLSSGIVAGIITGTLYQLVQKAYVSLQVGVSSYNAIYGSFAALPLFLIWLQIGWFIVLFGAEIAHYHQNFASYRHKDRYNHLSFSVKKILALQICHLIIKQFAKANASPLSDTDIAQQLDLPITVTQKVLAELQAGQLITAISFNEEDTIQYLPSQDTELISLASVIIALEHNGTDIIPTETNPDFFASIIHELETKLEKSSDNLILKEIIE